MIYIKILITLLISLNFAGFANAENGKKVSLRAIKEDQNYQMRVRTGNLAVDRRVYSAAKDALSEYIPVSDEDSYTGFVEILFSSTLGQGILGSKPAYLNNIIYGDKWFTDITNAEFSSPMEIESNKGGILQWQKSQMTITIKDLNYNKLWSAQYTYKGMQDIAGLMNKINDGANFCLDKIVSKFKKDFDIDQKQAKRGETKQPTIGLIVKNRWTNAGINNLGHNIHVDSHSINYSSLDIFKVWIKSDLHEYNFMDLIEINCIDNSFRYLEGRLDYNPSLSPHSAEWTLITPESTPERVQLLLCTR